MSTGRKTFAMLLLVVFLSFCISVLSLEEERKITAVRKLFGGFRGSFGGSRGGGGGGSSAGSVKGGGGGGGRSSAGSAKGGGGGGSSAGSAKGGGAGSPRRSGNGQGTRSGTITPAIVAGSAGSANAKSNERKNNTAAAIGLHAQPTYISLAAAILCVTILLFV